MPLLDGRCDYCGRPIANGAPMAAGRDGQTFHAACALPPVRESSSEALARIEHLLTAILTRLNQLR